MDMPEHSSPHLHGCFLPPGDSCIGSCKRVCGGAYVVWLLMRLLWHRIVVPTQSPSATWQESPKRLTVLWVHQPAAVALTVRCNEAVPLHSHTAADWPRGTDR